MIEDSGQKKILNSIYEDIKNSNFGLAKNKLKKIQFDSLSLSNKLLIINFYKILGEYKKIFKLLKVYFSNENFNSHPDFLPDWCFTLVQLGAQRYPLALLHNNLHIFKKQPHLMMKSAPTFAAAGDFATTWKLLQPLYQTPNKSLSLSELSMKFLAIRTLAKLGQESQALEDLSELLHFVQDPLGKVDVQLAMVNILNWQKQTLKSQKLFSEINLQLLQRSNMHKTEYLCEEISLYLQNNDLEKAHNALETYRTILHPGVILPEIKLGYLFFKGLFLYKNQQKINRDWAALITFPIIYKQNILKRISEYTEIPKQLYLDSKDILSEPHTTHIDLQSEVYFNPSGQNLGLNISDQVLAYLINAADFGIPIFRLLDNLWPDTSFFENIERFDQVLRRLRKNPDWHIYTRHLQTYYISKKNISVCWSQESRPKGWVFLQNKKTFTRQEVQNYFSISKSSALSLIKNWMQSRLVVKESGSNYYHYQESFK